MNIVFRGKWLTPNYQTNKMRNVWQTEEFIWKSCEWKDQLISTQSLLYIINAYWQNLKTYVLSDAFLVNFNWMRWASKECRKEKLKGRLEKGKAPSVTVTYIALLVWPCVPTLDVRKKSKKKNAITKHQYLKTWKIRFLQGFDKHFHRKCARFKPLLDIFKKSFLRFAARRQQADVLYANGGIGFCKYEAKNLWTITFALRSQGWIMADRVADRENSIFRDVTNFHLVAAVASASFQSIYYPWSDRCWDCAVRTGNHLKHTVNITFF